MTGNLVKLSIDMQLKFPLSKFLLELYIFVMKPLTTEVGSPPTGLSFFQSNISQSPKMERRQLKMQVQRTISHSQEIYKYPGTTWYKNILPHRNYELYCIILCHDLQCDVMLEMLHHFFNFYFRNHCKEIVPLAENCVENV